MEVILKFIKKDSWSGFTKYPGCNEYLGSVWTRSGNRYTGLTEEDARRLEKAIGYPENHLAPQSSFWITYAIRVGDKEVRLDLALPDDELKYLFAKGHKRVAFGMKNVRPNHDFVLINVEAEAEEANKNNKTKRAAFAEFNKLSPAEMRKVLRVYGRKTENVNDDVVENSLFTLVDEAPERFVKLWVENKNREIQYIIEAAISKNILRREKNLYYYGTDVIGRSLEDTISFLNDKLNQDVKLAILDELESK